jgi:hypothetical protein
MNFRDLIRCLSRSGYRGRYRLPSERWNYEQETLEEKASPQHGKLTH